MAPRTSLIVAAVCASAAAVATLCLEQIAGLSSTTGGSAVGAVLTFLLFPGILASMAAAGNAHAFHLWVAAAGNFVLYFLICWPLANLIGRLFRPRGAA